MDKAIAKNLLKERTCLKCNHELFYKCYMELDLFKGKDPPAQYLEGTLLSKLRTCSSWMYSLYDPSKR